MILVKMKLTLKLRVKIVVCASGFFFCSLFFQFLPMLVKQWLVDWFEGGKRKRENYIGEILSRYYALTRRKKGD